MTFIRNKLSHKHSIDSIRQSVKKALRNNSRNKTRQFDVIVLGAGSMGSAACYYLARQGCRVLGIDQFDVPNEKSSHAGQSRIIRKAYYELPAYVPLLKQAYKNWKHLESVTGHQVYYRTGLLYSAVPGNELIRAIHESADQYSVKLKNLSRKNFHSRFPKFKLPDEYEKIEEPDAGFVTPERAISLYANEAMRSGAIIRSNEKVIRWERKNGQVGVFTNKGVYFSEKLIITAGAWSGKHLPSVKPFLKVTRQVLAWVKPRKPEGFMLNEFPCWMIIDKNKPGLFYGFPMLPANTFDGPPGLKLAYHYPGKTCHPDLVNRKVTDKELRDLYLVLEKYIPEASGSLTAARVCFYTNTPDENFILDFLPGYDQDVMIAAGFSGHGFKFASVIGEILADMALKGKTELPTDFLKVDRFLK